MRSRRRYATKRRGISRGAFRGRRRYSARPTRRRRRTGARRLLKIGYRM